MVKAWLKDGFVDGFRSDWAFHTCQRRNAPALVSLEPITALIEAQDKAHTKVTCALLGERGSSVLLRGHMGLSAKT